MKVRDNFGNTPIDLNEAAGLRIKHIATQEELNEYEEQNIAKAMAWVGGRKRSDYLSELFIKELHRRMFNEVWEWAGEFRKSNKNIGVDWQTISTELKKLLDDTKYWIEHKAYPWNELVARFHHRLVWIHPFPNGNGRHSRLMTDLVNRYNGQPELTWGQSTEKKDVRSRYIAALKRADQGDCRDLVLFIQS